MRIYLACLGCYNCGEYTGDWHNLPIDLEELKVCDIHDEYAIHDYELPIEISEYESLKELNQLAEIDKEAFWVFHDYQGKGDIEANYQIFNDNFVTEFSSNREFTDWCRENFEDTNQIPDNLKSFIDWQKVKESYDDDHFTVSNSYFNKIFLFRH